MYPTLRLNKCNKTTVRLKINPISKNNLITSRLNKVIFYIFRSKSMLDSNGADKSRMLNIQ